MSDWWASDPVSNQAPLRVTVRPNDSTKSNWWDADPVAQSYTQDAVKSAGSGLVRGMAGLVGTPEAVSRYGAKGIDVAANYVASKLGFEPNAPSDKAPLFELPSTEKLIQDYEAEAGPLYEPKTKVGEFARTAAEFAPAALAGPGGGARAVVGNVAKFGIIPGLTSEAGGQATKGTAAEPYARVGGALVGAGGASALTRPSSAARAIRQQLPEGITPQMVDQAQALIADAAQRGITLSWPEALSQVAGRPVLSNVARHLEAAPATEARMSEFYGQRPQQVETAGRQALGGIAPPNNAPSTIGPAVGREAEGVVNDVRDAINRHTQPFYDRAAQVRLNSQEMAQVRALPGYEEARNAVRTDPQLNRYVANLPDESVGFLNEVKKYLDQAGQNAARPMAQNPNMQRAAGYGRDATAARQIGVNASQDYEIALNVQEQTRRQHLEPLLQGPLGKLADRDIATRNAINALFPQNPLANSAAEVERAVRAVANRSPRAAADLVRAHAEGVFNEATQALQSGANQAGGAKFRAVLVGNVEQRANFEAAVRALPNGQARLDGFDRFLDIMEAIGTRQNKGSMTAYNVEFLKDASKSGVLGEAAKGLTNPLGRGAQFLADKFERWRLGSNLDQLADILTNPAMANQLRAIARMPPASAQAQNLALRISQLSESSSVNQRSGR